MNYYNCRVCCCHPCCCVPKEPEQNKPLASLTPIIKKKKKAVVTQSCNKPEPSKVTQSKCPTNRIISISKLGDKVVVTLNDCTYYEADLSTIDLSTLQTNSGKVVVKVDANADNSLTVHYRDLKSGADTKEVITLPPEIHITAGSIGKDKNSIVLEMNDGSVVTIDMTLLKEGIISSITNTINQLVDNGLTDIKTLINNLTQKVEQYKIKETTLNPTSHVFTIKLNNDETFDTDFSGLITADKFVNSGAVISGNKLQLIFNDGSTVEIDLSSIVVNSSGETVLITGGSINGNTLTLNLSNNTSVDVDITGLISGIVNQVTNNIESTVIENATNQVINNFLKLGYRINTQDSNYTLVQDDFDGRTIVRMNSASNQTLTVIKPDSEEKIGTVVMVRRSNGNAGTLLTLVAGNGVTLSPVDISPLRRIGSSVSLIYIGKGYWDVFGELP